MPEMKYWDGTAWQKTKPSALASTVGVGIGTTIKTFNALSADNVSYETQTGFAMLSSGKGAYLASNAYWDGVSWKKFDTTKMGMYITPSLAGDYVTKQYSPATNVDFAGTLSAKMMVALSGSPNAHSGVTSAVNASAGQTVLYPTAFSGSTSVIFLTPINGMGSVIVTAASSTQFTFQSNINSNVAYYWLAIGN